MIPAIGLVCALAAIWCGLAVYNMVRLGLGFRHSLLFVPLQLLWRIDAREIRVARLAPSPVIYVVVHQSRIEPAVMVSLLPDDTLHMLDEYTARALWMEPWRDIGRTIAFNARHVFVSRRLVRLLRGRGRLAVYIPDDVEPEQRQFRLLRAVGRIASAAGANIVPILLENAAHAPGSLADPRKARRRWFPPLRIRTLPATTIADLIKDAYDGRARPSSALFDRIAQLRMRGDDPAKGLFHALVRASKGAAPEATILESASGETLSWRQLLTGIRAVGSRIDVITAPGDPVGLMLPNANAFAVTFFALQSAGRVATLINFTAGPAAARSAIATTLCRRVISSRRFVEEAKLESYVEAIESAGAKMIWLEDLKQDISGLDRMIAAIGRNRPLRRQDGARPAVILFTSGAEGSPKGVVLSGANILANCAQLRARIAFSAEDTLLNALPAFHALGLTGGMVLPLVCGVRLALSPSPLHFRKIAEFAAQTRPTILLGTDTFLAAYARAAEKDDFSSLRMIVAGAEPVRASTRALWRDRYGVEILEGYGMTEASPVVALNTRTHGKEGTAGRPLPGIRLRLEPVEGLSGDGEGLLSLNGPNVMLGYMTDSQPGQIQAPPGGWHDSGDVVSIDREGFVSIRGRMRRFAKIAGEMVPLAAIENLAHELRPDGRHVAVAIPDRRKGERIVLLTTAADLDRDLLRREGKKRGSTEIMAPDAIMVLDEVPMLATGKPDFTKARRAALEKFGQDEAA